MSMLKAQVLNTSTTVSRSNSSRTPHSTRIPWRSRVKSLLVGLSAVQHQSERYRHESSSRSVNGGRQQNEDRVYHNDREALYMVADGMGGYQGGALASQIVVETVPIVLTAAIKRRRFRLDVSSAFDRSVQFACDEMARVAAEHPNYQKMGCTLVAALIIDDALFCLSVGDCRAYLYRQGRITQLTRDQTMVQELVDRQLISASQAQTHRLRHIVTNSIRASGLQLTPELNKVKLQHDDAIVLASDGLSNELSASDFESVIQRSADLKSCADQLVDLAIERGAHDNASAVVVRHRASE